MRNPYKVREDEPMGKVLVKALTLPGYVTCSFYQLRKMKAPARATDDSALKVYSTGIFVDLGKIGVMAVIGYDLIQVAQKYL